MTFTGEDGFPCEFSGSRWGRALIGAVKSLDASVDDADAEAMAAQLWSASEIGRAVAEPRNRIATEKATRTELQRCEAIARRLSERLSAMHGPAVTALLGEGFDTRRLQGELAAFQQAVVEAWGCDSTTDRFVQGNADHEADHVTQRAALIYERVTGQAVTRGTWNDYESRLTGPWPEFLSAVFAALGIDASVEHRARVERDRKKRQ